jgi:hypothetical protein
LKKKVLFLGIFLAMALALCVTAAGATDAPAASQPTVKLWAFYEKDVNAYPTGWEYLGPVISNPMDWQQDSSWLPFPSPHYALYGVTWGSAIMGALIQEGDFGPGEAEIPLADGLYWAVLSAPPGDWQLTTDAVQKVYVWNGNVYVQWANEGLWYGDKVLVGIVDGAPAACTIYLAATTTSECSQSGSFQVNSSGVTPNGLAHVTVYWPSGSPFNNIDWPSFVVHPDGTLGGWFWGWNGSWNYTGTFTMTATDLTTGCSLTVEVAIAPCT